MATTWIRLSGRVVASAAALATLTGAVDNPSRTRATLTGTVSRASIDSFDARCIRSGYKVKLDGTWIPAVDLVGDLEIRESRDALVSSCSFGLQGPQWAPLATRKVWTRVPVEVWEINGPPGAEITRLRWTGYVRGCSPAAGGAPTVRVDCGDAGMLYAEQQLCFEVDPLAGMTRGEIVTEAALDVGLTLVDVPDGAEFTKPVQAINDQFGGWLRSFIEPELWWSRFDTDGRLRCWLPTLREAPEAADEVWDWPAGDILEIEVTPPSPSASRYVLRGFGAVHVDELGQSTKKTVVEIEAEYSRKSAVSRQETDGSVTDLGVTPEAAVLRLVQRITDTQVSRGGLVLDQETIEESYYNPRAARQVTDVIGGELDYRSVLIDEAGEYVLWQQERFVEVGRRRISNSYDLTRTQVGSTTKVYGWGLRSQGIQGVEDVAPSVADSYVYGDGSSYFEDAEVYGLREEHIAAREYDTETGHEKLVTTDSYGYRALRAAITPPVAGYYLLADGTAQHELVANWRRYARSEVRPLYHDDGETAGKLETKYAYSVPRQLAGVGFYQFGDFDAPVAVERWTTTDIRREQINVLTTDSWERVTYRDGEEPLVETFSGRPPVPRYLASVWSQLVQEPFELVDEDPTVEAWWGFKREVLSNDNLQGLDEAQRLVAELRARRLAPRVRVRRHQALAELGATIELRAPHQSLRHWALLIESTTRRNLATAAQLGEYVLEVRG